MFKYYTTTLVSLSSFQTFMIATKTLSISGPNINPSGPKTDIPPIIDRSIKNG